MRQLVNLPGQSCVTPDCALPDQSTVDIIYGATGESGYPGAKGSPGANGRDAFTTTTSPFSMPAVNSLASVQVSDNRSFEVGQKAFIAGVGDFDVTAKTGTTGMSLRNLGGTSAVPPGSLIGAGLRVTSGGQPGPDTPANTPKRFAIIGHVMDRGEDGGPMTLQIGAGSIAQGVGHVFPLSSIVDADSIVQIFGPSNQRFRLPVGSWKIQIRTPSYLCKAFQVYLLEYPSSEGSSAFAAGDKIASGNGYAGVDSDGSDPQRHAYLNIVYAVADPEKWLEVLVHQQSWSFNRSEPSRSRALGVASDFDDGAGNDVDELYTVIEIEEL
jgi:hypothetical protein